MIETCTDQTVFTVSSYYPGRQRLSGRGVGQLGSRRSSLRLCSVDSFDQGGWIDSSFDGRLMAPKPRLSIN